MRGAITTGGQRSLFEALVDITDGESSLIYLFLYLWGSTAVNKFFLGMRYVRFGVLENFSGLRLESSCNFVAMVSWLEGVTLSAYR